MSAMRKTSDHHHSTEQIEGYAQTALDMCDRLGLGAEDRAVLLPAIVNLVASKQVFYEQTPAIPHMAIPRNHR